MADLIGGRECYTVVNTAGQVISAPMNSERRGVIVVDADGEDVLVIGEVRDRERVGGEPDVYLQYIFIDAAGRYVLDNRVLDEGEDATVIAVKR